MLFSIAIYIYCAKIRLLYGNTMLNRLYNCSKLDIKILNSLFHGFSRLHYHSKICANTQLLLSGFIYHSIKLEESK